MNNNNEFISKVRITTISATVKNVSYSFYSVVFILTLQAPCSCVIMFCSAIYRLHGFGSEKEIFYS